MGRPRSGSLDGGWLWYRIPGVCPGRPPVYDHGGMDVWLTDEVGPGQSIDCSTPHLYTGLSRRGRPQERSQ